MLDLKNKTIEELLEIREHLCQAWVIQKSEYQIKQLKKVDYEIEKRKKDEHSRKI